MTEDEYVDAADLQKMKIAFHILGDMNKDNRCEDLCKALSWQIEKLETRIVIK